MEARHPALLAGYSVAFDELTLSTVGELGRGGFGMVTLGHYYSQEVAVKQLHADKVAALSDVDLLAIEKEFLMLYHLRHANVTSALCFNVNPRLGYSD